MYILQAEMSKIQCCFEIRYIFKICLSLCFILFLLIVYSVYVQYLGLFVCILNKSYFCWLVVKQFLINATCWSKTSKPSKPQFFSKSSKEERSTFLFTTKIKLPQIIPLLINFQDMFCVFLFPYAAPLQINRTQ